MKAPSNIRNIAHWENNCRKIHARAVDLLDGRRGVIETARALCLLASWTCLEEDADLSVFRSIDSETNILPIGEVRQHWAPDSLKRYDVLINKAEEQYKDVALAAAARIIKRFAWALDARNNRRTRE